MSLTLATWPAMERERERGINGDILEEKIFMEGKIFWRDILGIWWNFGKWKLGRKVGFGLWKKKKWKINDKEKIFSLSPKMKISETQIPEIESWMRKSFGKIPDASRNQVSRNDPK